MKASYVLLFLILVVIIAACGTAAPQTQITPVVASPPAVQQAAAEELPAAQQEVAEQLPAAAPTALPPMQVPAADPLEITVTLDESKTVEAVIPVEGGTLSLEAGDGTRFTLEIPADALVEPVSVRMTAVAQVEGLPFGTQQTHAVHLEPEGLFFYNFATLTIETPTEIPLDEQIFFGYQRGGKDVFLAPPAVDAPGMQILLTHFSGYGVTKGLLADTEPVRARLGGSDETRLQSQIAEAVMRERQRQEAGTEDSSAFAEETAQLIQEYYDTVVLPRTAAVGESCAAGRLAVETATGFIRQVNLLGSDMEYPEIDLGKLLESASRVCLQEEYELCTEQHIIHRMIPVWLSLERQGQLLGMSTSEEPSALDLEARELVEQCLTFELDFESTGKSNDESLGFEGSVSSSVPLRFDTSELKISGSGPLVSEFAQFYAEGCSVSYSPSDGTFEVFSLIYETDFDETGKKEKAGDPGKVTGLNMHYFPGTPDGPLSVVCDGFDIAQGRSGAVWFTTFMFTHLDEMSAETAQMSYAANDWTLHGGDLFAERSWQVNDVSTNTTEQGTMKLYHRPGK